MKRVKMKRGDEYDAFCARRFYNWAPGVIKAIKARYNRRLRKAAKAEALKQV
jgi:hypothetical protein